MTGQFSQGDASLDTPENRQRLARMITHLFDHWEISTKDQTALLGLSEKSRSTISRYRNGAPFANKQDLLGRAGHLLGIHKSLRLTFPNNIDLAYRWIKQPNRHFDGTRPLDVMKSGYEGIITVRRYLEFERER